MSKTKGNVIDPLKVIDQIGGGCPAVCGDERQRAG